MTAKRRLFVSYAHQDSERVIPEIERLRSMNFDVWYDNHISGGETWANKLADEIDRASLLLFFTTPDSIKSSYCLREINYCLSINKPLLAVHLEPTPVRGGIQLSLGTQQAILHWNLDSEEYERKLEASIISLIVGGGTSDDAAPTAGAHTPMQQRRWRVPYPRSAHFSGRQSILDEMYQALGPGGTHPTLSICGLGGVGKTQLALEYCYRHAQELELVAWLPSEQPEHLASEYADLCSLLGLPEAELSVIGPKVEAVRHYLERRSNWLLVFDNAPDMETVRSYLPKLGSGRTIITSRSQSWGRLACRMPVEVMTAEEAIAFFSGRPINGSPAEFERLAAELGFLPLALESAASYMEATGRTVESYLQMFQKHRLRLLDKGGPPSSEYPATLSDTWNLTTSQLLDANPLAFQLLQLFAMLGPDDIPLELLRPGFSKLDHAITELADDELLVDDCIAALTQYSLIKSDGGTIRVHRLVQLITREQNEQATDFVDFALQVVESVFAKSGLEGDAQQSTTRLLPHATVTIEHAEASDRLQTTRAALLRRVGSYLSARGRHVEGVAQLRRAIELYTMAGESRTHDMARTSGSLGLIEYALGENEAALESISRAADIYEELHGEHLHLAQELIGFCWVLRSEGMVEEGLRQVNRSIAIIEKDLPGNPLVGMPTSTRARMYWDLGDIHAALKDADQTHDHLTAKDMVQHPLVAGSYNNIAQVFLDMGRIEQAEKCVAQGRKIGDKGLNTDHALVSIARGIQGMVHLLRNDAEAAIRCFESALESGQHTTYLHEDIARWRAPLGLAWLATGDPITAREHLYLGVAELEHLCGAKERVAGFLQTALAIFHLDQNETDIARAEVEKSLATLRGFFGAEHPSLLESLRVAAELELAEGNDSKARSLYEQMLGIGELMPISTLEIGRAHAGLAKLQGMDDKAKANHREQANAILRSCFGESHAEVEALRVAM